MFTYKAKFLAARIPTSIYIYSESAIPDRLSPVEIPIPLNLFRELKIHPQISQENFLTVQLCFSLKLIKYIFVLENKMVTCFKSLN